MFIQFVPNWALDISKAAPWAIFGIFLIVFMYVMPRGIAGLPAAPLDPDDAAGGCEEEGGEATSTRTQHATFNLIGRTSMSLSKRFVALLVALRSCWQSPAAPWLPRRSVGVTATEIKVGNTNPYSGPASAYGTIGKAIGAYFKKVNDEGGDQRAEDQLHQLRRRSTARPRRSRWFASSSSRTRWRSSSRRSAPRPTAPSTST
mgnify:CR=1 FL=1